MAPLTQPYIHKIAGKGYLQGLTFLDPVSQNPKCHRFGRLPYASPLEDSTTQRWKRAKALPADYKYGSSRDTPTECSEPSDVCPQTGDHGLDARKMGEDCLQCNVWVPGGKCLVEGGWPVWIYIHGGFLQWGSPNGVDPSNLLSETEVRCVVVMPVYRLNVFGFLAGEELLGDSNQEEGTVGNLGFWDQRLAIEWAFGNIGGFGGNPDNITLGGLSAGAYSVFHQLSYELSLGEDQAIIRRVVMFSNGCGLQPKNLVEIQEQFDELVDVLGIPKRLTGKEKLLRLRAVSWEQLLAAKAKMKLDSFRAVTDGRFVRGTLIKEIENGQFAKRMFRRGIKMMIGDLPDEASVYKLENPPCSYDGLLARLQVEYTKIASKRLVRLYCPTKTLTAGATWQDLFGQIYADVQVHMTQRGLIAALSRTLPLSHLYRYRINWRAKCVDLIYPPDWGVAHGSDMAIWFFGNWADLTSDEKPVIEEFLRPFSAFLKGENFHWRTKTIREAKAILSDGKLGIVEDEDWDRCLGIWNNVNNIGPSRL